MAGFVCIVEVELYFPQAGDLKAKRKQLKSITTRLRQRFGAAVAEVDHHYLWQRAALVCVLAGRDADVRDRGDELVRWIEAFHPDGVSAGHRTLSLRDLEDPP
ncbi:MAG: DUF503 domain-containing protein [Solirubrobacterales bacterium]